MELRIMRENLVKQLKIEGRITKDAIENAFLEIPRENFIPNHLLSYAYSDTPLQIGFGQTISAPHMVAIMCEDLDLKNGQKILEIGTGSGYHAAIVSKIIGENGKVFSVERIESLAYNAKKNLKKSGIKNVKIIINDGSIGLKKYSPYDRIYVTCAAPDIPSSIINQLKHDGKLMIPVGKTFCILKLIEKKNNKILTKNLGGCAFVPLIGKEGF
jgi:protein-L-isoaspartate(D-aspartate) O-methyltransferase